MNHQLYSELDAIYTIHYNINSGLNYLDDGRFNVEINGVINHLKEEEPAAGEVPIGMVTGYKLLLSLAAKNYWPSEVISDRYQATMDVAGILYDFEEEDWDYRVYNHFKRKMAGGDLLVLGRIEIEKAYRNKGLGAKVIKDLYNNFIGGCALFALKSFPLQFEGKLGSILIDLDNPEEIKKRKAPGKMEKDFKTAQSALTKYYKGIGFKSIPGLDKDVLVINPLAKNPKFDSILLT